MPSLVELVNLTKSFGAVRALDGVSMHVSAGEVVGLMGDNGAGKSTLVKILAGNYRPTSGEYLIDGHPVAFSKPVEARNSGIEIVIRTGALQQMTAEESSAGGAKSSQAGAFQGTTKAL